ncbi:MAG: DNA primase [Acidimicrobiia bacterium]
MAERGDIDRVREATDLVELISEVTKVRKSGRSYMAVCPFHEEKTPSMSVDRGRGLYHCFGCGKGGDVFSFVQETQAVDFREAVDLLARKAGITLTIDPDAAKKRGRRAAAVDAIRRAIEVYHTNLKKAPDAGPARAYLRSRGYDVDVIDEWKIGFSGVDWDTLTKALKSGGISDNAMTDAGLSRNGRHGLYDVFRGRLMFPIHDVRGDPVGFGGRRIEEIDPGSTNNPDAKYVNSADSVVYHKANVLFGLDRARKAIAADGQAVIVEGYTDVIAMHQAGVTTAVATCGTALGDGHFDLLRRFSEKVVLAFDSDEAGNKAALRSDELESPFRLDLDLRVAMMPDGLDPADLVQQGRADELAKAVSDARPLLEQRIEHEVSKHDLAGPEGRARALHAAGQQLRRVNDDIARREYARFVARLIGVDLATVESAIVRRRSNAGSAGDPSSRPLNRADAELLRVIVSNPEDMGDVFPEDFADQQVRAAFTSIKGLLASTPPGTPIDVSRVGDPDLQSILLGLAMQTQPLPDWPDMKERIRSKRLDTQIDELESQLESLESGTEAHSEVLRSLIALQQKKRSGEDV